MIVSKANRCLDTIVLDGLKSTENNRRFPSSTEAGSECIRQLPNRLGDFPAVRRDNRLIHAHGTVELIGCIQVPLFGIQALLLHITTLLLQCSVLLIECAIFLPNSIHGSLFFFTGSAHSFEHPANDLVSRSGRCISPLHLAKHLIQ